MSVLPGGRTATGWPQTDQMAAHLVSAGDPKPNA